MKNINITDLIENELEKTKTYTIENYKQYEGNYLKTLHALQQCVDSENWEHFGVETFEEFGKRMFSNLGTLSLSRMLFQENNPIGYIECFLIKKEAYAFLYEDNYKEFNLDITDFVVDYSENKDLSDCALYVNVVAIKKEYQGSPYALSKLSSAMLEIYKQVKSQNLIDVLAVAVTENGTRMCELTGMTKKSSHFREMGENSHERILYLTNLSLL